MRSKRKRISRPAALAIDGVGARRARARERAGDIGQHRPPGTEQSLVVGDASSNYVTVSDQSDPACPGGPPCYQVDSNQPTVVTGALRRRSP